MLLLNVVLYRQVVLKKVERLSKYSINSQKVESGSLSGLGVNEYFLGSTTAMRSPI